MLELRGIERRFAGERGLAGVDLDVARGELVALIGPSGAGKSTLLRIIAGLDRADRGTLRLDGRDITGLGPADRRVGMTLDDAALYEHLTVRGNLLAGLDRFGLHGDAARAAADEAAAMVGATSLIDRAVTTLSAGERRRVGLARAIARKPDILLLDEPLTHLDHRTRNDLREDLRRVHEAIRPATILVTHDHADALAIADRLAYLDLGKVLQQGPASAFDRPAHVDVARGRSWHPMNVVPSAGADGGFIAFLPEDTRVGEPQGEGDLALPGTVRFRTERGAAGLVLTVALADGTRIRLPHPRGAAIDVGQPLRCVASSSALHRFAPDGARLGT